jgi:3-hydroxymyristoyl/3-hydroxydecanoyl-(acyl carrier protein) dehydratase
MSTALAWEERPLTAEGGRTQRRYRTRLPEDYAFFEGHFPGYPVLAGVAQLHELVLPCLRRARPGAEAPRQWTAIKFPKRICPGDALEVSLDFREGSREVEFAITRDGVRCTEGRLTLPAAGSAR